MLKAMNPSSGAGFGGAVAVHHDRIAVGAAHESSGGGGIDPDPGDGVPDVLDSGAVYVFVRTDDGWTPEAFIKASVPLEGGLFGANLELVENALVVSAQGAIHVFARGNEGWTETQVFDAPSSSAYDSFQSGLGFDGLQIVTGAFKSGGEWAAQIFR
jgi:hypothetical protein